MRYVALLLAWIFLALAIIGVFLPVVPTVPFLLLAAWCSAKGSPRLHRWLYAQPYFGKLIADWDEQKAVSRKSKIMAVLTLLVSWVVMYQFANVWVLAAVSVLFVAVAAYLLSRPEPH